jgi:hypothetical protein
MQAPLQQEFARQIRKSANPKSFVALTLEVNLLYLPYAAPLVNHFLCLFQSTAAVINTTLLKCRACRPGVSPAPPRKALCRLRGATCKTNKTRGNAQFAFNQKQIGVNFRHKPG